MALNICITGASSGIGALTARALAAAGHTVYSGLLHATAEERSEVARHAAEHKVDLRSVQLDVTDEASVQAAVAHIISDKGSLDVVVHNAGHMVYGPAEAFTPEQWLNLYDINTVGVARLNRAAVPFMRKAGRGLLIYISSSSARGGTPPYLAPYFAAKAGMDSLAVNYASELAGWGIETAIVVPGAFTKGTNHFLRAGAPLDKDVDAVYNSSGPYQGLGERILQGLGALEPPNADVNEVVRAIARIVAMPFGKRPFRTHIDFCDDGSTEVNGASDYMRRDLFRRIGLVEFLTPRDNTR